MSSFAELKRQRQSRQHSRAEHTQPVTNGLPDQSMVAFKNEEQPVASSSLTVPVQNEETIPIPLEEGIYDLPPTLTLRQSQKHGRGVYASQPVKKGSVVYKTRPAVAVLSTNMLDRFCSCCGLSPSDVSLKAGSSNPNSPLRRCTICRLTYYCSTICQKEDWASHKMECKANKTLREVYAEMHPGQEDDKRWTMSESIRAMGRLCWRRKAERNGGKDPGWWKGIANMESHVKRLTGEKVFELGKTVQLLHQYLSMTDPRATDDSHPLVSLDEFGFKSSSEVLNLVSAIAVNSFTLSTPSLTRIGMATNPTAAFFNHSCRPNAVVVFPLGATQMEIIALRNIEQDEEVLISYLDVSSDREERRADLVEGYGFECDCSLCAEQANIPPPSWTAQQRKVTNRAKEILKEDEQDRLDCDNAKITLTTLIPALQTFMPITSQPLHSLLRLQALLHTPPETTTDHAKAVQSLAMAYHGAEALYPSGHPTIAIVLAEWGKLLSMEQQGEGVSKRDVLRRLVEAVTVLRKAYTACEEGFGPGGGLVGKEVGGLIRGCEGEIGLIRGYST